MRLEKSHFRYRLDIEKPGAAEKSAVRLEELTIDCVRLLAFEGGTDRQSSNREGRTSSSP